MAVGVIKPDDRLLLIRALTVLFLKKSSGGGGLFFLNYYTTYAETSGVSLAIVSFTTSFPAGGTMQLDRTPIVYLASPLGFSESAKHYLLPRIIEKLEELELSVYEPFSTNLQNGLGPQSGNSMWALEIAYADRDAVKRCDAVFAVINGSPPDEGVAVELGIAIALGKPTYLFRDDFRKCADSNTFSCNLMLYAGLPTNGWDRFIYHSLDEICDPTKAIALWVAKRKSEKIHAIENKMNAVSEKEHEGKQKNLIARWRIEAYRCVFFCVASASLMKARRALT